MGMLMLWPQSDNRWILPLCSESQGIEVPVNKVVIVSVIRFSYAADVCLQEVFCSLSPFSVTLTLMESVLTAPFGISVLLLMIMDCWNMLSPERH